MSVTAGGLNHDQLVIEWVSGNAKRTLYVKEAAFITAFRRMAPPGLRAGLEQAAAHVRRARSSHRLWYGVAIGILIAAVLLLWYQSDALVQVVVDRIPIEWERTLGEAARGQFLAGQSVIKEGPAVQAVEEITRRLAAQATVNPYHFDVSVVRSDTVNAFALPGGYVVVFTGLLKKAGGPDEVAGVLAHELNHVLLRHGLSRIVKRAGLVAGVMILLGGDQGGRGLAKQLGVDLLTLRFSRAQETEADLEGLRLLHRARVPPDGMIRFFEDLSEHDALQIELLSTHPMSGTRAERLKAEAAALGKTDSLPFSFEWKTVQASL